MFLKYSNLFISRDGFIHIFCKMVFRVVWRWCMWILPSTRWKYVNKNECMVVIMFGGKSDCVDSFFQECVLNIDEVLDDEDVQYFLHVKKKTLKSVWNERNCKKLETSGSFFSCGSNMDGLCEWTWQVRLWLNKILRISVSPFVLFLLVFLRYLRLIFQDKLVSNNYNEAILCYD